MSDGSSRRVSREREPSRGRYSRSRERDNSLRRRRSTERPSQSRRSSSQNRSRRSHSREGIRSYRDVIDSRIKSTTRSCGISSSRSRSKSSTRSKRKGSKSPKAKAPSSSKYGSDKAQGSNRSKSTTSSSSKYGSDKAECSYRSRPSVESTERPLDSPLQNLSGSFNLAKAKLLLPDEQTLEENEIETKSLSLSAAEELSKIPKIGEIYNEVGADVKNIEKRLKFLSQKFQSLSITEANEIADAAYLLRLLRKPNHEIEMAGKMAHKGALLILQAEMLSNKGKELLEQSKNKLKFTML
ncbi:serine/threonine-protein kinase fray2-like [Vigna radiata var. radiata]|uniref:Serine/threonine-protein kinase fray2-like n=1 Tax=Vigna radiata var. radiata TaxID=3916 RepID=A0A3Q0FGZ7_VIGRR|nr:serine/threonine-protein kinase fray2-like [Vigna radiata var. radiata]